MSNQFVFEQYLCANDNTDTDYNNSTINDAAEQDSLGHSIDIYEGGFVLYK
jgi:hypothetical protein